MKLIKDNNAGVLVAWITVIFGLFFLVAAYAMFVPMANIIQDTLIELGSPYAPQMLLRQMLVWTFVGMGVGCIAFGLLYSYADTLSSTQVDVQRWI